MKAYAIQNQFGLENLKPLDLPDPNPEPGRVVVRVRAASLNYRDLMMVMGRYDPRQPLPLVPLSDGAGDVVAVGPGVTQVKVGDRVASAFFQGWTDGPITKAKARTSVGGPISGMLAERVALSEHGVVKFPDFLSYEEAATLPCAAVTAWNGLITEGRLQPGDTVLVQGTGGVSLFALQFAKATGARVLITSSSDAKLARAKELGADAGINYKTTPDWDKEVLARTDGLGVHHVVEVGGAGTLGKSLNAVRHGGVVSVIGVLSGVAPELSILPILHKSVRLQGIYVGSTAMFAAMNRAIAQNGIRPVIDRVFALEEAGAALAHLESGAHFGKIVIRI